MAASILSLSVANRREEMDRVTAAFEEFAQCLGVPRKCTMQILLALEELLLNSILYAFPPGEEQRISLNIQLQDQNLSIDIRDGGVAFDPFNDAPAPDLTNATMERRVGGLGVHIVKKTMDHYSYCREEGVNHTRIVKGIG